MPRGDILKYGNYVFELVEVPPFDSVQMTTFLDGAAIVEREDEEGHSLFGLINNHGDFVIPTNCRYIEYLGEGLFSVSLDGIDCDLYDSKGNRLTNEGYIELGDAADGFVPFKTDDLLMGYLDYKGNVVFPAKFTTAYRFNDGIAKVELYSRNILLTTYIDTNLNYPMLSEQHVYTHISEFTDGFATVCPFSQKGSIIIDRNLKQVSPVGKGYYIYETLGQGMYVCTDPVPKDKVDEYFILDVKNNRQMSVPYNLLVLANYTTTDSGLIVLSYNGYSDRFCTFIDLEKQEIRITEYDYFLNGYDGYYLARRKGLWTVLSPDLTEVTGFFKFIIAADSFVAVVKDSANDFLYASVDGNPVPSKHYRYAGLFNHGLAIVSQCKDHFGLIDRSGNIVVPMMFSQMQYYEEGIYFVIKNNRQYMLRELMN